MQLGMIGLGRMGANLVRRLMRGGHQCVAFDPYKGINQGPWAPRADGACHLADYWFKGVFMTAKLPRDIIAGNPISTVEGRSAQ